jgi:Ca2+-binding RTX toxin-like protein
VQFADGTSWNASQIQSASGIIGTSSADTINGTNNADTIWGRGGDDVMTGNGGNDTFVFKPGFGNDTINDFTHGADVVEFDSGIFADFAAVTAASSQVGSDVSIAVDGATSLLLKNVVLANPSQSDFHFV